MTFTGKLGSKDSLLGRIILGFLGSKPSSSEIALAVAPVTVITLEVEPVTTLGLSHAGVTALALRDEPVTEIGLSHEPSTTLTLED